MIKLFIIFIAIIIAVLLPVFAIISLLSGNKDSTNKLLWIIVIILLPYLGSIIYFLSKD